MSSRSRNRENICWPPGQLSLLVASTFASGTAALAYELLFARYLGHFMGHGSVAIISVLIAFMGGLSAGGAFCGRLLERERFGPAKLYVLFEAGIAVCALSFPFVIGALHQGFVLLGQKLDGHAALHFLKTGVALAAVFPPAFLMGGTVPAAIAILAQGKTEPKQAAALLYFGNTLGGVFGCLLCNFVLVPKLGLNESLVAGAVFNGISIALIIAGNWKTAASTEKTNAPQNDAENSGSARALVLWCLAFAGFTGMLYELIWTRMLALILGSTADAFAVMPATLLLGIALGSLIVSARATRPTLKTLGMVELSLALSVVLMAFAYSSLPYISARLSSILSNTNGAYPVYVTLQAAVSAAVLIIPSLLSGAAIPLAAPFASAGRTRGGIGYLFSSNALGAMAGTIATGLWLMPHLGLAKTLGLGAALNLAIGLAVIAYDSRKRILPAGFVAAGALIFLPMAFGAIYSDRWQRAFSLGIWRQPASVHSFQELKTLEGQNHVKFYKDGVTSTVSVNSWMANGSEQLILRVNGKPDASSGSDMATQILLAHIPMLLTQKPVEKALVIGFGSGVTCGSVACHPSVQRIDAVEISDEVIEAAALFTFCNNGILHDPRLHLIHDDARAVIETASDKYDVIISEPSNPWIAGVADVFTQEFYRACASRLAAGGMMAQWLHLYDNSPEAIAIVLNTFSSVFPNVSIWQIQELDILLVGSLQAPVVDLDTLGARFHESAVQADLRRIQLNEPSVLLSLEIMSPEMTRRSLRKTPLHVENRPILEQKSQRAFFEHGAAEDWLAQNENRSPRSSCVIAEYLKNHPLKTEDYEAFAQFYSAFQIPSADLMRSLCARWQNDPEAQGRLLHWLPKLPALGTIQELEALRLASLREAMLKSAATNPALLEHYAALLMSVYRSQRSIFYSPGATECRVIHERLLASPAVDRRKIQMRLAEMAFDRGDTPVAVGLWETALSGLDESQYASDKEFLTGAQFYRRTIKDVQSQKPLLQ